MSLEDAEDIILLYHNFTWYQLYLKITAEFKSILQTFTVSYTWHIEPGICRTCKNGKDPGLV